MKTASLICLLSQLTVLLHSQPEDFLIHLALPIPNSINLQKHSGYYCDTIGDQTAAQIFRQKENLFQRSPPYFQINQPERAKYWFWFQLENGTPDTLLLLSAMLQCAPDKTTLYRFGKNGMDSLSAGLLVPYHRLPYPPNNNAIPLLLAPGEKCDFLHSHEYHFNTKVLTGIMTLLTPEGERDFSEEDLKSNSPTYLYFACFFGIILFLLLFSAVQYWFFRNPAIPAYGAYLASILLYYLHSFEATNLHFHFLFKYFSQYFYHVKILLNTLPILAYFVYVTRFLELPAFSPEHSRWLRRFVWVFACLVLFCFWIIEQWGVLAGRQLFSSVIIGLLPFALFFVVTALRKAPTRLAIFILTGSCLLLLASVMTNLQHALGGYLLKLPPSIWGWYYHPSGWRVPVLDFKAAILLEMFCFSTGLAWKLRKQDLITHHQLEVEQATRQKLQRWLLDFGTANGQSKLSLAHSNDFLLRVTEVLEKHGLEEGFGITGFAKAMNMSRVQLYRKLHELTGKSPTDFIRHYRLQVAHHLLETSSLTVAEVAYRSGFANPTHFSRVFKQEFGISPKEVGNKE